MYQVSELDYSLLGDHTGPEVVLGESSWVWQRSGMSIGGTRYAHGVTVNSRSSVYIQLNRSCTRYEAMVGVDDLTMGLGSVRFSVFNGDGALLWQSPVMNGDDPAVPVSVGIEGQERIRLVVEAGDPVRRNRPRRLGRIAYQLPLSGRSGPVPGAECGRGPRAPPPCGRAPVGNGRSVLSRVTEGPR